MVLTCTAYITADKVTQQRSRIEIQVGLGGFRDLAGPYLTGESGISVPGGLTAL